MRTLLENLREDERLVSQDAKVGGRYVVNDIGQAIAEIERLQKTAVQLNRANRIIGWMMPYIGNMCPPENGLFELNEHCFENKVPNPGAETKGRPINQRPRHKR